MILRRMMVPTITPINPSSATTAPNITEAMTIADSVSENCFHSEHAGKHVKFSRQKSELQVKLDSLKQRFSSFSEPDPAATKQKETTPC